MKVLVVGSGGREHAIVWKLSLSKGITELFCAPGNGGIRELAKIVPIKATEIDEMVEFAIRNGIDMVVVGPDEPLAMGMVDAMESRGIKAFGPNASAAILESSKAFAKDFMNRYGIPTAQYESFENSTAAIAYLRTCRYPIVVKADGLALGKGVIIAEDFNEAREAVISMMEEKKFGASGSKVIVEEFLEGVEVSVLCFTDGKAILPMLSVKDHKRAYEGNLGPNTGGMGTIAPNPSFTKEIEDRCMREIFVPTMEGMNREGRKFKGVLYFGLMLTGNGPKVLEYNARFGDPETQVLLPLLKSDLLEIFKAVVEERLSELKPQWSNEAAVCVVSVSGGYPGGYETGHKIEGLSDLDALEVIRFHAGTSYENGHYYTAGGRVLGITAVGKDIPAAARKAYEAMSKIYFSGNYYRKDIGI